MNALYLTVFVSFVLAALGILLFLHSASNRTQDHIERLALLPLDDDDRPAPMGDAELPSDDKMGDEQ
ncbi:MAG: cytochrome oxidase [Deltaproteobacteria bacterium]|nr:cytochrome oxidase [Deltaproteobacteria bacterium]